MLIRKKEFKVRQRHSSDCFRAAVATLAQLPYEEVPDLPNTDLTMLHEFNLMMAERHKLVLGPAFWDGKNPLINQKWIGIVDALRECGTIYHAVVMDGPRLFHDPDESRKEVDVADVKAGLILRHL